MLLCMHRVQNRDGQLISRNRGPRSLILYRHNISEPIGDVKYLTLGCSLGFNHKMQVILITLMVGRITPNILFVNAHMNIFC